MPTVAKAVLFFLVIADFSFARAQVSAPGTGAPIVPAITAPAAAAEWPQVILNVLVDAKKGVANPIPASSLEIVEDGTPQKIESIAGPGSPVSLCILMDVSGSMTSKQDEARDSAVALVMGLPQGSEVTVSAFAEKSYLVLPFTPAAEVDLSIFGHLQYGHRTALDDSIVIAEPYFAHFARYPRRALVLITDGGDNVSRHSVSEAVRSLETAPSPFVYVLEIFDPYAPTPQERAAAMTFFPSAGVRIVKSSDPHDMPKGAAEISECINRQYALSYRSALITPDQRLHKIQVKLHAPDPGVKAESLPGYYIPNH
ncbi:MAG: VWA domain-containing protein [Terracidiphilus sp.]